MSLLSPRPSERLRKGLDQRKGPKPPTRTPRERLNRRGSLETKAVSGPKRSWLIALILCCATLATLDQTPVLEPARTAVGEALSPLETGAAMIARPLTGVPEWFDTRDDLRDRLAHLEAENSRLRRQVEVTDYGRAKLAEYESITRAAEVRKAIEEPLHDIFDAVRTTLDQTPPELAGDIMDRGIVLTGGGALLRGLDERLRHETGMPVHVAESPLTSVAMGAGRCVEDYDVLRPVLVNENRRW